MAVFTPPIVYDRPAFLPTSRGIERALFKFFPNRARYVYVFQLSDGTFVQDTPTVYATDAQGNVISVDFTNASVPYPWNPNDPGGPFSTSYYIDYSTIPQMPRPTVSTVANNPYIISSLGGNVSVYTGPTVISAWQQLQLTQAGYGPLIH